MISSSALADLLKPKDSRNEQGEYAVRNAWLHWLAAFSAIQAPERRTPSDALFAMLGGCDIVKP